MKVIDNGDTVRIEHRSFKIADSIEFWCKIDELYKQGYRFKKPDNVKNTPTFYPVAFVEFYKPAANLSKKEELLEFASKNGIEIPEDIKIPSAIKKYINEQMEM